MIVVVIEVAGGVADHTRTFDLGGTRKVNVVTVDWDNIGAGDGIPAQPRCPKEAPYNDVALLKVYWDGLREQAHEAHFSS